MVNKKTDHVVQKQRYTYSAKMKEEDDTSLAVCTLPDDLWFTALQFALYSANDLKLMRRVSHLFKSFSDRIVSQKILARRVVFRQKNVQKIGMGASKIEDLKDRLAKITTTTKVSPVYYLGDEADQEEEDPCEFSLASIEEPGSWGSGVVSYSPRSFSSSRQHSLVSPRNGPNSTSIESPRTAVGGFDHHNTNQRSPRQVDINHHNMNNSFDAYYLDRLGDSFDAGEIVDVVEIVQNIPVIPIGKCKGGRQLKEKFAIIILDESVPQTPISSYAQHSPRASGLQNLLSPREQDKETKPIDFIVERQKMKKEIERESHKTRSKIQTDLNLVMVPTRQLEWYDSTPRYVELEHSRRVESTSSAVSWHSAQSSPNF